MKEEIRQLNISTKTDTRMLTSILVMRLPEG